MGHQQTARSQPGKAPQALAAALDAIRGSTATVSCFPNPHYAEAESCEVMKAGLPKLDLRRLVHYEVTPCISSSRRTRCAIMTFDRGRADGSRTDLILETDSAEVLSRADVVAITISQGLQTSD